MKMVERSTVKMVAIVAGAVFVAYATLGVTALIMFLRHGQEAVDAAYTAEKPKPSPRASSKKSPSDSGKPHRVPDWWSWSPQQIMNLYEENELGAEAELDRRVTIVGLVDSIQRDTINQPMLVLQVGEVKHSSQHQNGGQMLAALSGISQGIVCRLSRDSVAAASRLARGDLVAVQGHGAMKGLRGIEFTDCEVTWVYSPDDAVANLQPTLLARVVDLCIGGKLLTMMNEKTRSRYEKVMSDAQATLAAAGIVPQCDHPLLVSVMNCAGEKGRAECDLPIIRNATVQLAKD